jgi:hypothetical protein
MAEEHDSWLEGLGINLNPSDAVASMASGLGDIVNSGKDAIVHGAKAVADGVGAVGDVVQAGGDYLIAAGLEVAGNSKRADDFRNAGSKALGDLGDRLGDAGKQLGEISDDVFGGDDASRAPRPGPSPKASGGGGNKPAPNNTMQADCKVVRGKVPGPANHVLCGTHGHILDLGSKTIIAGSLEEYKKTYGKGGSGGGGGGGSYGGQSTQPSGPKHGVSSKDAPDYADANLPSLAQRPTGGYGGGQDQDYGGGDQPDQPESPEYEGGEADQPNQPQAGYGKGGRGQPMGQDCKPVRGKCPGPANHVLCGTHGHVLDTAIGMIIANSVDDYVKIYGKGKGGGGGGSYGQSTQPAGKQKHGMSSKDMPDYGNERPTGNYGGGGQQGYGEGGGDDDDYDNTYRAKGGRQQPEYERPQGVSEGEA